LFTLQKCSDPVVKGAFIKNKLHKFKNSQVPVAHACIPSYSGGRDQDCRLKPAQANNFTRPYLEKPLQK
jgi:hypothetical protein